MQIISKKLYIESPFEYASKGCSSGRTARIAIISRKLLFILLFLPLPASAFFGPTTPTHVPSIMIDPSGDAQNPGRVIDDSFERGITLQCAEALKKELINKFENIRVVLTRFPGETVGNYQNANFANRLDIDFYLHIGFYQELDAKPKVYLYNFSYNDDFITKKNELTLCKYDQAHLFNYARTRQFGLILEEQLNTFKKLFTNCHLSKLPFKPLIGVKSPAIAFEAGLQNKDDWQQYIKPLVASLEPIINLLSKK